MATNDLVAQAPVHDGGPEPPAAAADDVSLQGRLAARREVLRVKKPFELVVPGYEGILAARYHALDYRVIRNIGLRQQNNPDQADAELKVATDTLVTACDELLEVLPDGTYRSTGCKWSTETAWGLFGVGRDELPEGSTARDALLKVVDPVEAVMHYAAYDQRARAAGEAVDREIQGEFEAGSAAA